MTSKLTLSPHQTPTISYQPRRWHHAELCPLKRAAENPEDSALSDMSLSHPPVPSTVPHNTTHSTSNKKENVADIGFQKGLIHLR